MKKYAAFAGFLGIFLSSCAQNTVQSNVPSLVVNAFQQKFSNATNVEWEIENSTYKVEFDSGGNEHEAWIDQSGKILSHKEELRTSQVPAAIQSAIQRDFAGFRTEDADKFETDGQITYKVEVKKGTLEWKATYDESGKLLSKIPD